MFNVERKMLDVSLILRVKSSGDVRSLVLVTECVVIDVLPVVIVLLDKESTVDSSLIGEEKRGLFD